jgi:hypothetical protein
MVSLLGILLMAFLFIFLIRVFSVFARAKRYSQNAGKQEGESVINRQVSKETGEYVDFEDVEKK